MNRLCQYCNAQLGFDLRYYSLFWSQSTVDASLYAYWAFNESAGTTATPTGRFTTAGTLTGATWVTGRVGGGINFVGSGFITCSVPSTVSQIFTVALWVKPAATIGIVSEANSGISGTTTGQRYIIDPNRFIAVSNSAGCT
jgi:hypothetical protein